MDALTLIGNLWPILVCFAAAFLWLGRLEGKVGEGYRYTQAVDRNLGILSAKHDTLDSKTVEQLTQVRESLARIEGALGVPRQSP